MTVVDLCGRAKQVVSLSDNSSIVTRTQSRHRIPSVLEPE